MKLIKNKFLHGRNILFPLLFFFLTILSCTPVETQFDIRFDIDKAYDEEMIRSIFLHFDPAGIENRAKNMDFPIELAKKIHFYPNTLEVKQKLDELVNFTYTKYGLVLTNALLQYKQVWQSNYLPFSQKIYQLTGQYFFYNEYICVISPFHPGISSWYGNKIVVKYNYQDEDKLWFVAWEITLSHIFHIVRQFYDRTQVDDWTVWKFAEIATSFLLRENTMKVFWPHKYINSKNNYFQNSNYPQLTIWETRLKKVYLKNKKFKRFMDSSILLLTNNQ